MNHFIPALFFLQAQHERYGNMHGDDVVLQPKVTINNVRRIDIKPAALMCDTSNGDLDYVRFNGCTASAIDGMCP